MGHILIWSLLGLLIILMYIFYKVYSMKIENKQKKRKKIIDILEKNGKVKECINNDFIIFEYRNEVYEIFLWNVPNNCEITFNSKKIWEIRKGSSIVLKDMSSFVIKPGKKIVLISPKQQVLKRYENENEMKFIYPNEPFWNMNAIFLEDLEETLMNGLSK
ncbi:conserved hypothetical protein [Alteracholeplasma palmae J233]|uniref:Uncharacterized protein n=1 Tax=Alteracholeplasma palmae (strain ATCC 49389 / J233) TaxID=1318466 RepID=U4KRP0_ALTPJ|nr:hypothetical protein [Alteracholeplasma palmae]CCV64336.1 conserved hypothetical protein [Alteracholeplasma palmae J233]